VKTKMQQFSLLLKVYKLVTCLHTCQIYSSSFSICLKAVSVVALLTKDYPLTVIGAD